MHVIIYLSKPIEYKTPRVNPRVNYGLWLIMMCQCRCILVKNLTILVSDADNEEVMHVGADSTWEISALPFQFCFKPKDPLNTKS